MLAAWILGSAVLAGQPTKRPSDAERGDELYRRHCVACHGASNDGKGPAAAMMVKPVPSLVGQVKPDDATVKIVLKGKAAMPGYEATFDRADALRVLKFMKKLSADAPMSATPGKKSPSKKPVDKVDAKVSNEDEETVEGNAPVENGP